MERGSHRFPYDEDRELGMVIVRRLGVQGTLNAYRKQFDANSCLMEFAISHLLPRRQGHDFYRDIRTEIRLTRTEIRLTRPNPLILHARPDFSPVRNAL